MDIPQRGYSKDLITAWIVFALKLTDVMIQSSNRQRNDHTNALFYRCTAAWMLMAQPEIEAIISKWPGCSGLVGVWIWIAQPEEVTSTGLCPRRNVSDTDHNLAETKGRECCCSWRREGRGDSQVNTSSPQQQGVSLPLALTCQDGCPGWWI